MDPSSSAAAGLAACDEELRGERAKAFEHYKKGNLPRATELLQKLLARPPAHPLLHCALMRLSHLLLLEQRQPARVEKQFDECGVRANAALSACPHSILPRLLYFHVCCDIPLLNAKVLDDMLNGLRGNAAVAANKPLNAADFKYAKAIATFDEEVFTLALLPDVCECADPAEYRREALICLAKAPAKIVDLHREAERLAKSTPGQSKFGLFIDLRDAEHAAVAAQRLLRMEAEH